MFTCLLIEGWQSLIEKSENFIKSLSNYNNLTIRISRVRTFGQRSNNGWSYLFIVRTDEMPGCSAHGSTISEALNNFQKTAELWLKWFDNPS